MAVAFWPMRIGLSLVLLLGACGAPAPVAPELAPCTLRERWVYSPLDLEQSQNVDKLIGLMDRSAKLGFNTLLLEDPNFGRLPLMDDEYFRHLERIKAAASEHHIDLVPAMFQIGHSENLLSQDPNLAEGLPVRDQLYVVRSGVARVEADPPVGFRPSWDHRDPSMSADWVVQNPQGKLARVWQKIRVSPYRQYHVSVLIRTREFKGTPRIVVIGGGRLLNYNLQGAKPTQDWTEHHAVFNSLGDREVRVSFGCWDGETGEAAFSEPKIEETGLVNVLRRPGAPIAVKDPDGETLKEGVDFEYLRDRKLGREDLPGGYSEWHEPPALRTRLADGTRLRVSYYHMLRFPDGGQVMICPSEPRTIELLQDQARRLHQIFHAKAYFMSHDEVRVCNWDSSCTKRNMTAGQILADNVRTCIGILRGLSPTSRIYVWSDMFDPHHNAHDHYYLARGGMQGTWEGLDPDVIVATWFYDKRDESLQWFSSRGHQTLIAGYYDQKPERARDWLESAAKVRGTIGIMYTSWYDHYEDLETFS
ncbi:MAG TPA: hypothetical protein VG457_08810, partial [Planctomycetota bacterium]|nr:hypothetical protein [Planctomycetota bacterium]